MTIYERNLLTIIALKKANTVIEILPVKAIYLIMMTFTDMNFNSLDIVNSSMQRRFTSGKDSLTSIIFVFDY